MSENGRGFLDKLGMTEWGANDRLYCPIKTETKKQKTPTCIQVGVIVISYKLLLRTN